MRQTYTFRVLRYIHDTTTGEFLNVGVALYAPQSSYLSASCRTTYGRLAKVFPGIDGDHFRRIMRHVTNQFNDLGERLSSELDIERRPRDISDATSAIIPPDDGSLQWSSVGSGLTTSPSDTLKEIYDRMVERYEEEHTQQHLLDSDVYRKIFKPSLDAVNISARLTQKRFASPHFEKVFKYACLNGRWHVLEPLSFDLSNADGILRKAHTYLGELISLQEALMDSEVHTLVGAPSNSSLNSAFTDALAILQTVGKNHDIVTEDKAEEFSQRLAQELEATSKF